MAKAGGFFMSARSVALIFALSALTAGVSARAADPATTFPATESAPKAAAPRNSVALPALLRRVEKKYAGAKTLTAKFVQVVESALSKQKQTSQGELTFERPNRVRWETISPDHSLFVSNGVTAWFYTPPFDPDDKTEHGEYHERKASQIQTKLANALLSGSFSVARDMSIEAVSKTQFSLTPRKKTSDPIRKAIIEIDPHTEVIRKVTVEHRDGNKTEITLSNISLEKA